MKPQAFHSSAGRIEARARLRTIAASAAAQTGRDPKKVLQTLVAARLRREYSDDPHMLAGALEFEVGLHHRDVQREQLQAATAEVLDLLAS